MERYFHAEILEQKRQKERQLKNQSSKLRLQEIASGSKTQWSGNILHDLKGVNESVVLSYCLISSFILFISSPLM